MFELEDILCPSVCLQDDTLGGPSPMMDVRSDSGASGDEATGARGGAANATSSSSAAVSMKRATTPQKVLR